MDAVRGMNACPANNICVITSGEDAPACGVIPDHMAPLATAERYCLRALAGTRAIVDSQAPPNERLVQLAWVELELGRATPDEVIAAAHFRTAKQMAAQAITSDEVWLDRRVDAAMLLAYMDPFVAIRAGKAPQAHDRSALAKRLVGVYDLAHTTPNHHEHTDDDIDPNHHIRAGVRARVAVALLALRNNTLLLYASPRERVGNYPQYNDGRIPTEKMWLKHNYYDDSHGCKLPIRASSSKKKGHGHAVLGVTIRDLVDTSLQRLDQADTPVANAIADTLLGRYGSKSDLDAELPMLTVAEARGYQLQQDQLVFLDLATDALKARMDRHRAELTGYDNNSRRTPPVNTAAQKRLAALGLLERTE